MRTATTALAVALTATLAAAGPAKFQRVAIGAEGVNHNARSAAFEEGGRFTAINASLHVLIVTAYRGVWPPQETPALQVLGGPDWLGTEGFTIAAGLNFVGGPVFNQTDLDGIFDVDFERPA